ncbi:nickel insertion protein [Sporosarcina beigongshangi]|uniref:nickel insertion protein n=1 Tax=Sporosarcina beigongshangi TaxID=2782538 RepID=UPI00193ACF9C|nr:nickel insertion protein [Sporosarcina beigongshangi]
MASNHPPNHEHVDHEMLKMEVNLDDISGEVLGYLMDLLIESGANDVYYTSIYMKKNRPGTLLQLLCSQENLEKMKHILFTETTTLGIRYYPISVHRLERRFRTVKIEWGTVTVKDGIYDGQVIQSSPEFEECKKIAEQHHIPLKKVYEQVWMQLKE